MNPTLLRPQHLSIDTTCSQCKLRDRCLPGGLTPTELQRIELRLVRAHRRVARAQTLFRTGEAFHTVYAVYAGSFKTSMLSLDGSEQVTGFQLGGDLIGLDGLGSGTHALDAVAMEDSEVCAIPLASLLHLSREFECLQSQLHKLVGRELRRQLEMMALLGNRNAEQRLASFLLDLRERWQSRGQSGAVIVLTMSRLELGSLLGLTVETVSRTFSKFHTDGTLGVNHRIVQFLQPQRLQALVNGDSY